jgi:hypothetical protein
MSPSLPALLQVDRKVLQLEMERLSLGKAADTDRGARQRLSGLDSQLEGGWAGQGWVAAARLLWHGCSFASNAGCHGPAGFEAS